MNGNATAFQNQRHRVQHVQYTGPGNNWMILTALKHKKQEAGTERGKLQPEHPNVEKKFKQQKTDDLNRKC